MLNSRSAFQLGEYSATWKHTTQGPLTVPVNHTSEKHVNRSSCSVTINCASQKGRHCSGSYLFSYFQPGSVQFRAPGEPTTALLKSCPTAQVHTSSTKALPSTESSRIWCHFLPPPDTRALSCHHQTLPSPRRLNQACEKGRSI